MFGYIYQITNKINGKRYIGKTNNAEHRLEQHYSALKKGKHHSVELQRAFDKYGWENFDFTYELFEVEDENALKILEIKTIEKYDSYHNGYNETIGGDGKAEYFDFSTRCSIHFLCQKYKGIKRRLANYFHCDNSVITSIERNELYSIGPLDEQQIQELIEKISITDADLVENYKPLFIRRLTKEQVFEFLSVVSREEGYVKLLCKIFQVSPTVGHRLYHRQTYKNYIEEYDQMTQKEKDILFRQTLIKYDLESQRAKTRRNSVKNPLTQDMIDYILDNQNLKKRVEIAKDLNVSADRVGAVILGQSYKDLVKDYYARNPQK